MRTGATGAWLYLAGRAFVKFLTPSIRLEDSLQSRLQRFLSHDITAFIMTVPTAILFGELSGWSVPSVVNCFIGAVPLLIGGAQFLFDACKLIRGGARRGYEKWGDSIPAWIVKAEEQRKEDHSKLLTDRTIDTRNQLRALNPDNLQLFLESIEEKDKNLKKTNRKLKGEKPDYEQIFSDAKQNQNALMTLVARRKAELQKLNENRFQEEEEESETQIDKMVKKWGTIETEINSSLLKKSTENILKSLLQNAIDEYNRVC